MNSREQILSTIRQQKLDPVEHPSLDQEWIQYEDAVEKFSEMVAAVGGTAIRVGSLQDIQTHLQTIPAYREGKIICSLVDGLEQKEFDWNNIQQPSELALIDYAVFQAEFGVAENGAVWVTSEGIPERAIFVLPQHLACVVPAKEILNNMHEAYERLSFSGPSYGMFISGPSKTADIEQSLVIGAHGARSLTVYVMDE